MGNSANLADTGHCPLKSLGEELLLYSSCLCFVLFILVMDKSTAQGRSPAEVARDVLAAVGKKKKDVILGDLLPSLAIYLRTLAPGLFFSLMASRARKERKSKTS